MESIFISMVWGFTLAVTCTNGYQTGAPLTSCASMFPEGHGVSAQTTAAPYRITVQPTTYTAFQTLVVTLSANNVEEHEGAFLQARRANCTGTMKDQPVGTFSLDQTSSTATYKLVQCDGIPNSAVTHKSNAAKSTLIAKWIAPSEDVGPIYFRATVVETKTKFWMSVSSDFVTRAGTVGVQAAEKCPTQSSPSRGNNPGSGGDTPGGTTPDSTEQTTVAAATQLTPLQFLMILMIVSTFQTAIL